MVQPVIRMNMGCKYIKHGHMKKHVVHMKRVPLGYRLVDWVLVMLCQRIIINAARDIMAPPPVKHPVVQNVRQMQHVQMESFLIAIPVGTKMM